MPRGRSPSSSPSNPSNILALPPDFMAKSATCRLAEVKDWPEQARIGGYRVKEVAALLEISSHELGNFVSEKYGEPTKAAFVRWKIARIRHLAAQGLTGDEMAKDVGLADHG